MSTATVTCGNCRHEFAATGLFCPHCGRAKVRDADGDVLLGKMLGERFVVTEKIGQGTSGTIYKAEHVTLRRKVAIKVLHHELSRDDLALERFRREATTVGDIDNEHIVEIHDFGRTPDGRLYLAMELLEGDTLDKVLERDGQIDVERTVDIITQVGEALIEAHAIGYVHRDIRPRNILLSYRRGRANFVKILDFGLTKLVDGEGTAASTSLGMTFGDPRYMSPEQARGDLIDRRADLYQLGCVAYEMLTGQPPFVGGRVFDVLSRHVSETPVPVGQRRPGLPAWLEAAVMRMLSKKPDERFATMSRMVEALRQGQATGKVMGAEVAQQVEAEPPPSVSRIMAKLGRTSLGPHGDEVAAAAAAPVASAPLTSSGGTALGVPAVSEDDALTRELERVGPRGTPKVLPALDNQPTVNERRPPDPATPSKGGVWARPKPPEPEPEREPVPTLAPSSSPKPPAGSTGKLPTSRARRPSAGESSGISQVWFADGDQLDGGTELDEKQAARLDRARRLMPASGDSLSEGYIAGRSRPVGKMAAIGVGAVLLVVVLAVVVLGGSGGGGKHAKATVIDAGAPPADAAVIHDAAPTPDAAPAKPGKVKATGTGTGPGKKPDRTDPLDPIEPDPEPDPLITPDDEAKAKAEFFAKAGEGQLNGGDAAGAASNFKKALELDPKNVNAVIGLGEVAMQQGIYDAAIKHLKKASKMTPRNPHVHVLLGEAYLNSGNEKSAEASFKKALQLDPDNARARNGYNEAASRIPPPEDD